MGMIDDQLIKAQHFHQQGKLSEAIRHYQLQLQQDPRSDIAFDGLGLAYLQCNQAGQAIPPLRSAIKLQASIHDYHYHLAEAYNSTAQYDLAIAAYRQAIRLCPQAADYHFSLGNALTETGNIAAAISAFEQTLIISPGDAEAHNNLANNLADTGHINAARQHLEQALQIDPAYAEAYVNLAQLLIETGNRDDAISLCEKAALIKPGLYHAHLNLGHWLALEPRTQQQALSRFQQALSLRPDSLKAKQGLADTLLKLDLPQVALPLYQDLVEAGPHAYAYLGLSHCLIRLQKFAMAEKIADKIIDMSPELSQAYLNRGICLQAQGRFSAAKAAHYEALNRNPALSDAAYHLAILDPNTLENTPGFQQAVTLLSEHKLSPEKQLHLHFSLGKLAENKADFQTAFDHFQQANSIKATLYPFDEARYQSYIERIIDTFSSEFLQQRKGFGLGTESPVFIVGMPRSGSTLVEQILNAHPQVCGIGEHREMREITRELPQLIGSGQVVPECVSDMDSQQSRALARRYLDSLPDAANGFERSVDKMLGNILRLGLIALLFPRARIIHCQRQALDTCLSCYTQDFSAGLRFTTGLRHLGRVYKSHLKLMQHWTQVLPMKMMQLNYEDLVCNPESTTRALIRFCDLPWDKACLQHHAVKSNVATASFLQVRQPIYRQSVGKWKVYEPWLGALLQALE